LELIIIKNLVTQKDPIVIDKKQREREILQKVSNTIIESKYG